MKIRILVTCLCGLAMSLTSQFAYGQQFYGGFDYLRLNRSEDGGSNRDYIYSDNNGSLATLNAREYRPQSVALSAADLPFEDVSGFRAFVGARLCDFARVEASYFWLNDQFASNTVGLPTGDYSLGTQLQNNNQAPVPNIDVLTAAVDNALVITTGTARRTSDVEGFEFNFIGRWQNGGFHLDPILGLRGFQVTEQLDMALDSMTYQSRAENFIFGLQAGADLGYTIYGCDCIADFGIYGKAGVGYNSFEHAINTTTIGGANAPSDDETDFAQFADLGAKFSLTWRFLEVHVGYQVLAISGVELGGVPADMYVIGSSVAEADDTVFFHGFFGGGSITF